MKFVLVNGRTPYPQTFCMLRCESIKSGYLRATTTQYPYYDYECTAGTDEAGHAFQLEAGRVFQSEAGHPWRQSHGSI